MVDVACGMACGRDLPCGMHKCQRICHKDACLPDGEACRQPCTNKRTLCDHMCAAPCHPNKPCPISKCKAMVSMCVCVCVCVCVRVWVGMSVCVCACMYVCACVHLSVSLHVVCICISVYVCLCVC